ncbi:helix-turn-helix domain-containing protein, partial [Nocardiopsis metallicus]
GWAYSLQSSAIIAANMASPGVTDVLEERRRVASGADIPWQAATETPESGRPPVGESELSAVLEALLAHEDTRRQVVDVIADMETSINPFPDDAASLTDSKGGSARSDLRELPENTGGDQNGSAVSDQAEHAPESEEETEAGSAGSDQAEHEVEPVNAPAVRAASEAAEQRRTDALALWEQGWSAQEIAAQMRRDKRTVRGYLTDQGVTAAAMDQRVQERVAAYIEAHGQDVQTRPMAADLHLTRSEAKAARAALGLEHRNP